MHLEFQSGLKFCAWGTREFILVLLFLLLRIFPSLFSCVFETIELAQSFRRSLVAFDTVKKI